MNNISQLEAVYNRFLTSNEGERDAFLKKLARDDPKIHKEFIDFYKHEQEAIDYFDALEMKFNNLHIAPYDADYEPGARIGNYRLDSLIGAGGMAYVFKASRVDGIFQRESAIKLIKRGIDTDQVIARFEYERHILAKLQHEHITQIYDGGITEQGLPYFVMEYVEGDDLIAYCNKHHYAIKKRLTLFIQLCHAMEFAHKNLVIHRDIKPGNIMVTPNEKVKLMDFGIAKILKEPNPGYHTGEQANVLTPDYASPEQLNNHYINTSSDIYQLGILLYELVTHLKAYNKDKGTHILEFSGTTVPLELISIIQTATRTESSERYNSVENLKDDIINFIQNKPIKAKGNDLAYRTKKYFIRNRKAILSVFIVFFSLGFLIVRYIQDINEARRIAEYQSEQAQRTESFLYNSLSHQFPRNASGDSLTVFDLIDRMATQLQNDKRFPKENVSRLFNFIADITYRYKNYEKSNTYYQYALNNLHIDSFNPIASKQNKYSALVGLGRTFFTLQKHDSSIHYLNQGVSYALKNGIYPVEAYTLLARLEMLRGNYNIADSLFSRTYLITKKRNNLGKEEVAYFYGMYGNFLSRYFPHENDQFIDSLFSMSFELYNSPTILSQHDAQFPFFQRKDTIYGSLLKHEYQTSYAEVLNFYGGFLYKKEAYDSAAIYFDKAYQANKKYYGENSIVALESANNLALIFRENGEYEKAKKIFLECWNKSRKNANINPAFAIGFFQNYAVILYDIQEYNKALHVLDSVIRLRKKHTPSDHFSIIHAYSYKGQTYRKLNQPKKGLELLEQAVSMHKKYVGDKGFQDINAQLQMILLYGILGDYANVEKFYQDNLEKITNRFGDDSNYLFINSIVKASALLEMHKYDKAEAFVQPMLKDSIPDKEKNHLLLLFARSKFKQGHKAVSDSILSVLQNKKQLSPIVQEALDEFLQNNPVF